MSIFDEHITSKLSDIDTVKAALKIIVEDNINIIRDVYRNEIQFNRSSIYKHCKHWELLEKRKVALKNRVIRSIQRRDSWLSTLNPDIEIYTSLNMYSETPGENVVFHFSIYIPSEGKTVTYTSGNKTYQLPDLEHFELIISTSLYKK